jgi:hypothetical protein
MRRNYAQYYYYTVLLHEGQKSGRLGWPGGACADDFGERGDFLAGWDLEACAEVVPEGDAEFGAGLVEAQEGVAAVAAGVAAGSAADLALGDLATNVVLGSVGVQRDIGSFEHSEQFALVGAQACEQTVEGGEAGLAAEDAIEPRRQGRLARQGWMAAPSLETSVVPPDQDADAALGGALGVGERIEFVNQTFGVDPAQAMRADIELAGVVADDHGVGEQAMRLDAALAAAPSPPGADPRVEPACPDCGRDCVLWGVH